MGTQPHLLKLLSSSTDLKGLVLTIAHDEIIAMIRREIAGHVRLTEYDNTKSVTIAYNDGDKGEITHCFTGPLEVLEFIKAMETKNNEFVDNYRFDLIGANGTFQPMKEEFVIHSLGTDSLSIAYRAKDGVSSIRGLKPNLFTSRRLGTGGFRNFHNIIVDAATDKDLR